jgi:hypothetical protein
MEVSSTVGVEPTIRGALDEDLPKVRALLQLPANAPLERSREHQVLVLDDPRSGSLAAAAIVVLQRPTAHLQALVMSAGCACARLEERLLGVAWALARAFGCRTLDVPGRAPL